jgi:hypothetical protein
VLWYKVPGAVLILGVTEADPIELSGSGAELWDLLEQPTTASGASALLSPGGEVDPAVVTADIERVLQELEERGLVERAH